MFDFSILSILTFLPLIGAAFILTIRGDDEKTVAITQNIPHFISPFLSLH